MQSLSFGTSLLVTLVGMMVVFLGLLILIGLIKVLAVATSNMGKPKTKKVDSAPAPAPATEALLPADQPAQTDDALIAVITAAVACMLEDGNAFVVRRVRRVSSAPAWQKAGREEQIYSHF